MKLVLTILLITFFSSVKAQIANGIYESTVGSFRANYFLKVDNDSLTLIGWETNAKGDTIYFKSTCKNDKSDRLTFTKFHFSRSKCDSSSFKEFVSDPTLNIQTSLLYMYFFNFHNEGDLVVALATKDIYDSGADRFKFAKLK